MSKLASSYFSTEHRPDQRARQAGRGGAGWVQQGVARLLSSAASVSVQEGSWLVHPLSAVGPVIAQLSALLVDKTGFQLPPCWIGKFQQNQQQFSQVWLNL